MDLYAKLESENSSDSVIPVHDSDHDIDLKAKFFLNLFHVNQTLYTPQTKFLAMTLLMTHNTSHMPTYNCHAFLTKTI